MIRAPSICEYVTQMGINLLTVYENSTKNVLIFGKSQSNSSLQQFGDIYDSLFSKINGFDVIFLTQKRLLLFINVPTVDRNSYK